MKIKLYTLSHDINILKELSENRFTQEEHAMVSERELGSTIYTTRNNLLRYYLPQSLKKFGSLSLLIEYIKANKINNIISFGAGNCILEWFLKLCIPDHSVVIATDFDAYFIEKANNYFPEISAKTYDFCKDDFKDFYKQLDVKIDLAIFFGSSYVMDDEEFIKLFSDLKKMEVNQVIDFNAGALDNKDILMQYLKPVTTNTIFRKVFRKSRINKDYKGKFHGYSRDRRELNNLYIKSGWTINKGTSTEAYKYVAFLK